MTNTEALIPANDTVEFSTKAKVGAGIAVAAYLGACYLGGYLIGRRINKGRITKAFSDNGLQEVVFGD